MLFKKKTKPGDHELKEQGGEQVMHINYAEHPTIPSIEADAMCMAMVIEKLSVEAGVARIIFHQNKNYEYGFNQTQLLTEIAHVYNFYVKQKKLFTNLILFDNSPQTRDAVKNIQYIVLNLLRTDPIGAYVEARRLAREIKIANQEQSPYALLLTQIEGQLQKTKMMQAVKDDIHGYEIGNRALYNILFQPSITPNFMFTRLMATPPLDGVELDAYNIAKSSTVQIYQTKDTIKPLYHLIPPEFKIDEDKQALIDLARSVLAEHEPKAEEFIDPKRMRKTFFNIGRDLLTELTDQRNLEIPFVELEEMAHILVRYTVGFGLIETLLEDEKVQDISINGPIGQTPIFIVHADFDECVTNIIPSKEDGDSWATKLRLISARPLDEANPILDTELTVPAARARVAVIGRPLNPWGIGFSIRRHRDKSWTLPLFVQNGMISDIAAGVLSFLIDGARTLLVAGTRSSGKTSLLGAVLVEIMRKYRLITIEDSVTGDSEILIREAGEVSRTTVGQLIDKNIEHYGLWYNLTGHEICGNDSNLEILAMDKKGKIKWAKPTKLIRHKVEKPIYKLTTRTGKIIKVTGDHSLFGIGKSAKICEVKTKDLKKGDFIATARKFPWNLKPIQEINLLDYLERFDKGYFHGTCVKKFLKEHKHEIIQLGKEYNHNRSLRSGWLRKGMIPLKIIKDMKCLGYNITCLKDAKFKYSGNSGSFPVSIKLSQDFLTFVGLWIADGCYDTSSVILSVVEEENRQILRKVAKQLRFNVKMHSDKYSLMGNSKTLKEVMKRVFELRGNAYTKRIPQWVFNLSKEQIAFVLKGVFSGDGHVSDKEIVISLSSRRLLEDMQNLLLQYGILLRIRKYRSSDKTYPAAIGSNKFIKRYREQIGILPAEKKRRLNVLCALDPKNDASDVIPLDLEDKKELKKLYKPLRHRDYIYRNNNIGREKMGVMLQQVQLTNHLIENLQMLTESDLFWDQIKYIEVIEDFKGNVYDFSVPGCESFITGGIIAHNTLELPTDELRSLGHNIQPMKVRSALATTGTEVAAEEGIRTSLRLGDSSLIVGEIRSTEAIALYEAMRVGALANVVAGTIHGDSPYGVFDRVVNDLGVPRTSFKATDIIVVANPIKTADGLHRKRRVTQITEVRKTWENDPLAEGGFVDLFKYNGQTDTLEPTDALINGESEIIKAIGGQVKEWAGNWDAIWQNILLRAKMKRTQVDYAGRLSLPGLLEAESTMHLNDEFHKISDMVRQEKGQLDAKKIFFYWEEALKKHVKMAYKRSA